MHKSIKESWRFPISQSLFIFHQDHHITAAATMPKAKKQAAADYDNDIYSRSDPDDDVATLSDTAFLDDPASDNESDGLESSVADSDVESEGAETDDSYRPDQTQLLFTPRRAAPSSPPKKLSKKKLPVVPRRQQTATKRCIDFAADADVEVDASAAAAADNKKKRKLPTPAVDARNLVKKRVELTKQQTRNVELKAKEKSLIAERRLLLTAIAAKNKLQKSKESKKTIAASKNKKVVKTPTSKEFAPSSSSEEEEEEVDCASAAPPKKPAAVVMTVEAAAAATAAAVAAVRLEMEQKQQQQQAQPPPAATVEGAVEMTAATRFEIEKLQQQQQQQQQQLQVYAPPTADAAMMSHNAVLPPPPLPPPMNMPYAEQLAALDRYRQDLAHWADLKAIVPLPMHMQHHQPVAAAKPQYTSEVFTIAENFTLQCLSIELKGNKQGQKYDALQFTRFYPQKGSKFSLETSVRNGSKIVDAINKILA